MCSDKVECEEYDLFFHHKTQNKQDIVSVRLFPQPLSVCSVSNFNSFIISKLMWVKAKPQNVNVSVLVLVFNYVVLCTYYIHYVERLNSK